MNSNAIHCRLSPPENAKENPHNSNPRNLSVKMKELQYSMFPTKPHLVRTEQRSKKWNYGNVNVTPCWLSKQQLRPASSILREKQTIQKTFYKKKKKKKSTQFVPAFFFLPCIVTIGYVIRVTFECFGIFFILLGTPRSFPGSQLARAWFHYTAWGEMGKTIRTCVFGPFG